jgi:hypothetical protein
MESDLKQLKEEQQRIENELDAREKELDKQIADAENSNKLWKAAGKGLIKAAAYTAIGFSLG